ncbi:MAG: hypothetical protein ABI333_11125 [bacterium]
MSEKEPPNHGDDAPETTDASTGETPASDSALEQEFFAERTLEELRDAADEEPGNEADEDLVEGEDELRRLMAPKRTARHPVLAGLVVAASLFGMVWLWDDFRYFLRPGKPQDLGLASQAVKAGKLKDNAYVTLTGAPVTQSMATSRYQSMFGGASSRRLHWLIMADTGYRVVVRARRPLIVDKHKPGPHIKLRGTFTGRLRRLDATRSAAGVRRFYREKSRASHAMRPFHRVAGVELLRHAGQPGASLKDVLGKSFPVHRDSEFALFVAYPGEYEFSVHTELKDSVSRVSVEAGQGAPQCGKAGADKGARRAGAGGSVYIRHDPSVMDLGGVAKLDRIKAGDGVAAPAAGGEPTDGAERVIAVPPGTVVFNAQTRDCDKVCKWAPPACRQSCTKDEATEITKGADGRILVAVGGLCGGAAGEKHAVNLQAVPFKSANRAEAYVASLGYPYVLVEDSAKSRRVVRFIVRMPRKVALEFTRRQGRTSPYNIAPREEVFFVKWRYLKRSGSDLVLLRTKRGYPNDYTVESMKGRKRLRPVPVGATLQFDGSRVIKADISALLELPKDTYILEEGVKPSSMWEQPFLPGVPIFYLLLLGFIVFNLFAMRAYFRG